MIEAYVRLGPTIFDDIEVDILAERREVIKPIVVFLVDYILDPDD